MDASHEEEACASCRLSLGINRAGNTLAISKDGPGGIPYSKLHDIISVRDIIIKDTGLLL